MRERVHERQMNKLFTNEEKSSHASAFTASIQRSDCLDMAFDAFNVLNEVNYGAFAGDDSNRLLRGFGSMGDRRDDAIVRAKDQIVQVAGRDGPEYG
jgi:hypothetical protein